MRKSALFHSGTSASGTSFGLLVLRVGVGLYMLLGHGLPKLQNFDKIKEKFPVPDIVGFLSREASLCVTIGAELGAAALLVVGLLTRPAALVLAFTMAVAAFQVKADAPWTGEGSRELAMMYLNPFVALLITGAGKYSIDRGLDSRR